MKNKDALKVFRELLAVRAANAKLTDGELAKSVGVSKGLISQIKSGVTTPSKKFIPSLAWVLNERPSSLYDDVCMFLNAAGFDQPCRPLADLAAAAKESIWMVLPAHAEQSAPAVQEALDQTSAGRLNVRLFTTHNAARSLRALPSQPKGDFVVKTPSEALLNIEHDLLFLEPEASHSLRIFRRVPDLPNLQFAQTRESPCTAFLLKNLAIENQFLNVAEMAKLERRQGEDKDKSDQSLIILYTDYFPEEKEDLLFEAVKHNLTKHVRYLYLVDQSEYAAAKITHGLLRNRLRHAGIDASPTMFTLHAVDSSQLFRDGTFIVYATKDVDGIQPNKLIRQVLGSNPVRFQQADKNALAHFYNTFLRPVLDHEDLKKWLEDQGNTK